MLFDRLEDGFVHLGDVHAQRVRAGAVRAVSMTDIFRPAATLLTARLHDQTTTAERTCRQAGEQVLGGMLRRAPGDPSAREPHRLALDVLTARGDALPERLIN